MGPNKSKLVTIEEARGHLPAVQTIEAQLGISQTTPRPEGLSFPEERDITIEKASEMTVSDLHSGLPTFLTHFDSLEFNSLPTSHFHRFGPPFVSFLRFSVPVVGLSLLKGLLKVHGDFTSGFRGGVFLGNILRELCAVLVSLKDTSLDSLSEGRILE